MNWSAFHTVRLGLAFAETDKEELILQSMMEPFVSDPTCAVQVNKRLQFVSVDIAIIKLAYIFMWSDMIQRFRLNYFIVCITYRCQSYGSPLIFVYLFTIKWGCLSWGVICPVVVKSITILLLKNDIYWGQTSSLLYLNVNKCKC